MCMDAGEEETRLPPEDIASLKATVLGSVNSCPDLGNLSSLMNVLYVLKFSRDSSRATLLNPESSKWDQSSSL